MEPVSGVNEKINADANAPDRVGNGSRGDAGSFVNLPGHVIPIVERELEDFESETAKFIDGQTPEVEYIAFRLRQGVYGQRQPGVQMIRVKLPFGGVTPDQMDAFGEIAERFAPLGKGHVTTRQNFQFHHVPLARAPEALELLGKHDLSSREGCGNTVRNVTGDPWAGVSQDEPFDPTPYAAAYARYFVRRKLTQLMPRKIKTAFSASDEDRAICTIHDIAFVAVERNVDGEREQGFRMLVGGGTSMQPRIAPVLYEFVSLDDYLKVSEAVLRIFDRCDELRKNRARARLKVYVDRIGIEAFRREVDRELELDWTTGRDFSPHEYLLIYDEASRAPSRPTDCEAPDMLRPEFDAFVESNVRPQRQSGFSTVEVRIPRGDLTPEQFRGLATIMRNHTGGCARTSIRQNVVLRWVRDESLYDVWEALGAIGLGEPGADQVMDVVSCPGTDSCKLGITGSMGLNRAIGDRVESMDIDDPLTRRIHIKISGCPHGCGQHHIATIGFYGASIKMGDRTVPAYIPFLAGSYENGSTRFAQRLKTRIPAKRVPEAVERFIRHYQGQRDDGEPFDEFVVRTGTEQFEDLVRGIGIPTEFTPKTLNEFIDWDRKVPFVVERGEGECAI